jgi:hypothetical protein
MLRGRSYSSESARSLTLQKQLLTRSIRNAFDRLDFGYLWDQTFLVSQLKPVLKKLLDYLNC